jgi:threonine 3-dehydrogenase
VMLESGLNIAPVITHHFSWREHEQAFAVMQSGNCGKVILDWRESRPARFTLGFGTQLP